MKEIQDAVSIDQIINHLREIESPHAMPMPQLSEEQIVHVHGIAFQLYRNGKYRDAKQFFHFLTLVNPFDRRFWMGYGACQQMLKEFQGAIECYSVAAIQEPQDPYVHWHAAECFFNSGQKEKGLEALHSALSLAKQFPEHQTLSEQLMLIQQAWEENNKVGIKEVVNG